MQDTANELRAAEQAAGAARYRLTLNALDIRTTHRTAFRHHELLRLARPAPGDHGNHFGNHVTGAARVPRTPAAAADPVGRP